MPSKEPWASYTYGDMPRRKLFKEHFKWHLGNRPYKIRVGNSHMPAWWDGDWDADDLYDELQRVARNFRRSGAGADDDNSNISVASSILYTLGFEWI